jgi:hypothetical protein
VVALDVGQRDAVVVRDVKVSEKKVVMAVVKE